MPDILLGGLLPTLENLPSLRQETLVLAKEPLLSHPVLEVAFDNASSRCLDGSLQKEINEAPPDGQP